MDRQLELIKRNISALYLEVQEEFKKVNTRLSAPPANLSLAIGDAMAEQLSLLRSEVADTIGTRIDKERKVMETVLGVKLNDIVNRQVEMQVEFRMQDFEARLAGLRDAVGKLQSGIDNAISEAVDSKLSMFLASMNMSGTQAQAQGQAQAHAQAQAVVTATSAAVAATSVTTVAAKEPVAPVVDEAYKASVSHVQVAASEPGTQGPSVALLAASLSSGINTAEGGAKITIKKAKVPLMKHGEAQ